MQAPVVEDGALEGEVFDGRRAVVEPPERVGGENPGDGGGQRQKRQDDPDEREAGAGGRGCFLRFHDIHDSDSTTSNMPIQPSSVNSV